MPAPRRQLPEPTEPAHELVALLDLVLARCILDDLLAGEVINAQRYAGVVDAARFERVFAWILREWNQPTLH